MPACPTPRRGTWLTVLEASYIIFQLPPFHANIRKRLIKSPKLYFCDVGLASYLIGIEDPKQLVTHPLRGALFENLVVAEALKHRLNRGRQPNLSFFRDARGLGVRSLLRDQPGSRSYRDQGRIDRALRRLPCAQSRG